MTDFSVDFFTSPEFIPDPHPYFDYLRGQGPVVKEPHHGVMAVTGYEETLEVLKDGDLWSSCVSVGGPFPPLPFTPQGDDIREQIAAHRTQMPLHEHMVAMDPPNHTRARSLLSRLLTPKRRKDNEDFLLELADSQLDEFVDAGECEFLTAYSKPFSLLAVEAIEGTDAMLVRAGGLRREGLGGVLVKCVKPGQSRLADLPTVGPRTVEGAAAAGLRGLAFEANGTILLERETTIGRARAAGLFLLAFDPAAFSEGMTA